MCKPCQITICLRNLACQQQKADERKEIFSIKEDDKKSMFKKFKKKFKSLFNYMNEKLLKKKYE